MRPIRIVGIGIMSALVTWCAGCGSQDPGLPTISTPTATAVPTLEDIARTYYGCMVQAGVPVELRANTGGAVTVVGPAAGSASWVYRDAQGVTTGYPATDPAVADLLSELSGTQPGTIEDPVLYIDGVDYSEPYAQCLAMSGYDEQAAYAADYQPRPEDLQRQVQADNQWAACARDNGYPGIEDTAVSDADDVPPIWLPGQITPDQLRMLLQSCPNFDPGAQDELRSWWNQTPPPASAYPPGYLPAPLVVVDTSDLPHPLPAEEQNRLDTLIEILNQAQTDYDQTH